MPPKKQILLSLITSLWLSLALAQDPQPAWRNYNTDHGLPSSEVYVAMQDSKGYMWFGTDNGVSRFDGYTFQNYGPADGLQNNVVFDIQEDNQGRIWMMTMSGNAYYHEQDSIYPFEYNDTIQNFKGQFNMGVHLYFDDMDSSLYVTLQKLGILQIKADGNYRLFRSKNPAAMVVLELKEKVLYTYSVLNEKESLTYNKWFNKYKISLPIEFHRDTILSLFPNDLFNSYYKGMVKAFNDGNLLIEYEKALGLIRDDSIQWVRKFDYDITSIFKDNTGNIFFCINNGFGVRRYKNIESLKNEEFLTLLQNYSAANMTQDRANGYWFTTQEKGIYYTTNLNAQIYDKDSGLSDSYVTTFVEKNDSTLYIGLRDGKIFKLNTKNHTLIKLPPLLQDRQHRADKIINVLLFEKKTNKLYAGGSLQSFDGNNWELINFNFLGTLQNGWPVVNLFFSRDRKNLWCTAPQGLSKVNLYSETMFVIFDYYLKSPKIFSGFEDFNKQLWLGRIDGLWKLQADTLVQLKFMHPSLYNRIEAIQQLPDRTFVLGTKGRGVILWKDTSYTEITVSDGLTSNMIENIYVDEMGIIWVGTLKGLNQILIQQDGTFSIKKITIEHGLPSNEINKVKVINDEVWVATTKGLVRFPYEQELNVISDPPFFEAILINDEAIDWEKTNLTFSHLQNNISFQFLTINYRQNGKIPYRYRLSPAQRVWKETQNREVSFPTLDNGGYTFEVQSQNEDGFWSDSTTFAFKISLPWWETWWAISLGLLAITVFGFVIYKNRTDHLKKEIILHKQIAEIERQALRSQMNPHFIFNALNAIQGYIAQGDKLAANRYLSRFAKLIRSALQHSRLTKVPLEDDLNSLKNYMELEQMRFKGGFDFQIDVADEIDTTEVTIPPMLIQPFVENAIVHGLTNLDIKGKIDIDLQRNNGILFITIKDNGIGIEASKKQKAGIASAHKSVGMTITKRRLEMLSVNRETGDILIQELKDESGKVLGTKVSLQIPLEE